MFFSSFLFRKQKLDNENHLDNNNPTTVKKEDFLKKSRRHYILRKEPVNDNYYYQVANFKKESRNPSSSFLRKYILGIFKSNPTKDKKVTNLSTREPFIKKPKYPAQNLKDYEKCLKNGYTKDNLFIDNIHICSQKPLKYEDTKNLLLESLDLPCYKCGIKNSELKKERKSVDEYNRRFKVDLSTYEKQKQFNKSSPVKAKFYPLVYNNNKEKIMECHRHFCELKEVCKIDISKWNYKMLPKIFFMSPLLIHYYSSSEMEKSKIYSILEEKNFLNSSSTRDRIVPNLEPLFSVQDLRQWCNSSPYNMMPLCTECHRELGTGIHYCSYPNWFSSIAFDKNYLKEELDNWRHYNEKLKV